MAVALTTASSPAAIEGADTVICLLGEGFGPPLQLPEPVAALVASGEAKTKPKAVTHTHHNGRRYVLVGAGKGEDLERFRAAAAVGQKRAAELGGERVALVVPDRPHHWTELVGPLVEGFFLAAYRFERFKPSEEEQRLRELVVVGPIGSEEQRLANLARRAQIVADAANSCRDLQNRPANDLTPTALGEEAKAVAQKNGRLSATVAGREEIVAKGMGAFAAVAQGSAQEPALITLRYTPPQPHPGLPVLGLVGKAVTFDSGGISLKPAAKMAEMKFDMSGGAAVLCATAAIAALELPIPVVAVIGATENLPGGRAVKPGDIVRTAAGKTVEINNTDAEGRLVLADCLHHAREEGATVLVDLATLTGAVVIALGSTYAGLLANDDGLAERLIAAGQRTGELLWRLPLHEEYDELIKGRYAEINNAPEQRKAGTIVGGAFLANFAGGVPWAHLDIAGVAWDLGRPYANQAGSGFGVRLLVELAEGYCATAADRA